MSLLKKKKKNSSYKSDIWALGCVLYEITTLRVPFEATNIHQLSQRILKSKPPAIHPAYSRGLSDLIAAMLSKNPERRPSARQILNFPYIRVIE